MRSMIWKSTFREIKESLGRFLAILAIVALGVGFFAGLKVTQPAMLKTAQRYFDKTALYDYRLISTVGFSEDEYFKWWCSCGKHSRCAGVHDHAGRCTEF